MGEASDDGRPVTEAAPPVPAATVILVRDGEEGVETVLLRRDARGSFAGMWVFPGGRVDEGDADPGRGYPALLVGR